jgi:hypothetical protein
VSQLPTLDELKGVAPTQPASSLSVETQINPDRLHGSKPPTYQLTEEKAWHRSAAYLFATGCVSTRDVAQACNVSEPTVRNLLRNDWFQERVTQLMAANGGKDIMSMFRAEQFRTLAVLLDLRDGKETPAPVKFNVCRDILDRTLGKPVQRIETEDKTQSDDPVAEAKRLEEELSRTRGG